MYDADAINIHKSDSQVVKKKFKSGYGKQIRYFIIDNWLFIIVML